jgi:tetratricopeptide (TPR) repeat protein
MGQSIEWSNYKNANFGITFDYPSSWTISEKTNRFELGPDISVIGPEQQIFAYTAPVMDIEYFDAYVKGLSIGLNIGTPYSNLQIVENYDLHKYGVLNQTTATALYAYDINGGERVAEQEFLVYKDRQVHSLKFRDIAKNFDSQESQDIRNHIINSFDFIETPQKDLEELDRTLAIETSNKYLLYEKASLLQELGRYAEAVKTYDQILALYPKDLKIDVSRDNWMKGDVLYDKGIALFILGNYSTALEVYDELISFDPDYYKALYMKANILFNLGNLTEAGELYDKALEGFANYATKDYEVYDDILIKKDLALSMLGNYSQAFDSYDEVLEMNSTNIEALSYKADTLFTIENYTGAIYYYDKILDIVPNWETTYKKSVALHNNGNFTEAIEQYDFILSKDHNNSDVLNSKGLTLMEMKNYTGAIQSFDKVISLDPENFAVYNNKGYSLFKLGKIDEALQSATKSIQLDHDYADAWYNMAIYYLEQNKIKDALSTLTNAIMLDYNQLNKVNEDHDFDKIRNNTNFVELISEFRSAS